MKEKIKKAFFRMFSLIFFISLTFFSFPKKDLYASEINNSVLIQKVSKDYTKRFCNAVGFGLSKESAMDFSFEENKQVFKKRKEFNSINKELLAEVLATSVVEKCGYPIKLSGDKGVQEFKNYYLSKNIELSKINKRTK